jgi:hypothetical protein
MLSHLYKNVCFHKSIEREVEFLQELVISHSMDIIRLKVLDFVLFLQYMSVDQRLTRFLEEARDWEKTATRIPGLFLLKLPGLRGNPPSIAIEINPVDASGSPTKKRGVVVRSAAELGWIRDILSNPKAAELAERMDKVNPQKKEPSTRTSADIFEV